jgi:hypothetical protein
MKKLGVAIALAVALSPAAAQVPNPDSVKAAAVLARHIAATGGEAKLRALKARHMVMTTSMPATLGAAVPTEARSEVYMLAPNLIYMKLNLPGLGTTELGYDGKIAWSNSTVTGPMILPEVPKQLADMSDFTAPPFRNTKSLYTGVRELDGAKHDVLRMTLPDSQKVTAYYATTTGLLARMDFEATPPSSMTYHDYRIFDGLLISTKQVTRIGEMGEMGEMVVRVVSLDHKPIDRKIFAPPANAVKQPD